MVLAQHVRQHLEAIFLRVVETHVERRAGVGDALERGAALGHGVGALRQAIERRARSLRLLARGFTRLPALGTQLRHVAQRLLESRPVLGLVGRELETGLERGNARIGQCSPVFGTQMMMAVLEARAAIALWTVPTLLRIHNRRAGDGEDGRRGDHWLEHVLLLRDQGAQIRKRSPRIDKLKFGQVNDCSRLHLRNFVIIDASCYEINRYDQYCDNLYYVDRLVDWKNLPSN